MFLSASLGSQVPRMLKLNATRLVDVWLWECHYQKGSKCHHLARKLIESGISVVYHEPFPFEAEYHRSVTSDRGERLSGKKNTSGGQLRRLPNGTIVLTSITNGLVKSKLWL